MDDLHKVRMLRTGSIEPRGFSPDQRLWARVLTMGIRDALKGDKLALIWINRDTPINGKVEAGCVAWICQAIGFTAIKTVRNVVNFGTPAEQERWLEELK